MTSLPLTTDDANIFARYFADAKRATLDLIAPSEAHILGGQLPDDELARYWKLASPTGDLNHLSQEEFIICCCMVKLHQQGHFFAAVPEWVRIMARAAANPFLAFFGRLQRRLSKTDAVKVMSGEHAGRYGRISEDAQGDEPYRVRFYDGTVSEWMAEDSVCKVSEDEKTRGQQAEKDKADSRQRAEAGLLSHASNASGDPCVVNFPSYWQSKNAGAHGFLVFNIRRQQSKLFQALKRMMHVPDPLNLGKGRDVVSRKKYSGLVLRRAWRVESPILWMQYMAAKFEVGQQMRSCPSLRPLSTKLQQAHEGIDEMSVDSQLNEVFLLHGTKPDLLFKILSNGLVEGFCGGIFGQGNYLAENPCKNDQYVAVDKERDFYGGLKQLHDMLYPAGVEHPGNVYYLLVCRVVMGHYVRTDDASTILKSGGKALWAKDERVLAQIADTPFHYHSLVAETGGVIQRHREFLVFKGTRIYPEYVLAYQRH
uniref:Poly [ADP-ribose] polymerase n=1 Tax=Chrysotila carterae TaxID=13221 RepID=A0A7S4B746_CHRCT